MADPDLDAPPVEAFLAGYPDGIHDAANTLRAIVSRAVPDAIERVRPGRRLIGYDVLAGRRTRYFAFVVPERLHVHLGFEHGTFLADPDRILEGAHLRLRKVRFVTINPGQAIPEPPLAALTREAARIAVLSREARLALLLDDAAAVEIAGEPANR